MQNSRLLPLKSAYNFRDLGGYRSANGKYVKWGVFLRSGDFPELSEEDLAYLQSVPVRTIVDFRAHDEVERLKDSEIPGATNYNLSVDSGNLVPQFMQLIQDKNSSREQVYQRGTELMKKMYNDIICGFTSVYRRFFSFIQNQQVPILFHCTAGKDRTGIAAALLLSALGVDRQNIYNDFLMTNECLKGKYDHLQQYGALIDFFQTVQLEYLESAFAIIDEKFGGIDNYLTVHLGVNIQKLRDIYLE